MSVFALISLICAWAFFGYGVFVWQRNTKASLNRIFALLCLSASWWAFTEFGYRQAETLKTAQFWLNLNGLWPLTLFLFLHFVLVFTGRCRMWRNKLTLPLLYFPALFFAILQFLIEIPEGKAIKTAWGWTYGVPHSITGKSMLLCADGVSLLAFCLLARHFIRAQNPCEKSQTKTIAIAGLVPIALSIIADDLLPYSGIRLPEMSVPGMAIGFLFIGHAIWKYELFSLDPAKISTNVFSTMSDLVIVADIQNKIRMVNPSALRVFGYGEHELLGQTVDALAEEREKSRVLSKIPQLMAEHASEYFEVAMRTKSGNKIDTVFSVSRLEDNDHKDPEIG